MSEVSKLEAACPGGVQGFWFERVASCHERIARQLNMLITNDEALPEWMTVGRTIMCQKDPTNGIKLIILDQYHAFHFCGN